MIFGSVQGNPTNISSPTGGIELVKLTCSNCGAVKLTEERENKYACEYCGATYIIETDPETGNLIDIDITGKMEDIEQVFAIHGKLEITGSMNDVTILESAPDARHVGTLKITGSMNDISVVLLDGAQCEVKGNMNDINHQ